MVEKSNDETNAFVEKLWAMRRVGEIIDEFDLKGQNDELVKELVELSTRHGILTPYTSFLADETTDRFNVAASEGKATRRWKHWATPKAKVASRSEPAKSCSSVRVVNLCPQSGTMDANKAQQGFRGAGPQATYFDAKQDKQIAVDTVQSVGRKRSTAAAIAGSMAA